MGKTQKTQKTRQSEMSKMEYDHGIHTNEYKHKDEYRLRGTQRSTEMCLSVNVVVNTKFNQTIQYMD